MKVLHIHGEMENYLINYIGTMASYLKQRLICSLFFREYLSFFANSTSFECLCYTWPTFHIINSVSPKSKFGIVSQLPSKVDKGIRPRLQKLCLLAYDSGHK